MVNSLKTKTKNQKLDEGREGPVGENSPSEVGRPAPSGGENLDGDMSSRFDAGALSDTGSWCSFASVSEKGRKRRLIHRSGSDDSVQAAKVPARLACKTGKKPKAGTKAKPISVEARRQMAAARRDEAEKLVSDMTKRAASLKAAAAADREEGRLASALKDQADANLEIIKSIASSSGNLKGTFVKGLKEAAAAIEEVVVALGNRTATEETERLQAVNRRLEAKVTALEQEMAELRAAVERSAQQAPVTSQPTAEAEDAQKRLILDTVGPLLNARIEGLQSRLLPEPRLRPPLAADRRIAAAAAAVADMISDSESEEESPPAAAVRSNAQWRKAGPQPAPEPNPEPKKGKGKKGKGKGKKSKGKGNSQVGAGSAPPSQLQPSTSSVAVPPAPRPAPTAQSSLPPKSAAKTPARPAYKASQKPQTSGKAAAQASKAPSQPAPRELPPAPASMSEGWSQVVKRGAGKTKAAAVPKAALASAGPVQRPNQRALPTLRPPRSAAVTLKLQPDAEKRGVTYAQVMAMAQEKVDIGELGIPGIKLKRAATGARLIEISGAERDGKADALAAKLREALDPAIVEVSRPIKSVDLRVLGLCDSATPELVRAAVARRGECPEADVRVGEIREDHAGTRTAWVRCPVAAAKRLTSGGRLLVGWVSVQVKLLPNRPMQCFRCLETGHVSCRCTAEVDRSSLCFRCGEPGHKAAQCSAAASCVLCTAAGKPAGHRVGSAACPSTRRKRGGRRGASEAAAQTQPARTAQQAAEAMETGASQ